MQLDTGTEQGLVGILFLLGLLTVLFATANRLPPLWRGLWLSILTVWCIDSLVGTWEYRKISWLLFGLLAAHSAVVNHRARCESSLTAEKADDNSSRPIPTAPPA